MTGRVLGRAAAGLADGDSWVANAGVQRAGAAGEARTAAVLAKFVRETDATVLHDLRIPLPGVRANIDHVVVSGRDVILIDSKAWAPGFLWTVCGYSFRGLSRFKYADSRTIPMAANALTGYLGSGASVRACFMAIWSTRTEPCALWLLRPQGARAVRGEDLPVKLARYGKRADEGVVQALARLMVHPATTPSASDADVWS